MQRFILIIIKQIMETFIFVYPVPDIELSRKEVLNEYLISCSACEITFKMLNRIMIQFKIKTVQNRGEGEMSGRG